MLALVLRVFALVSFALASFAFASFAALLVGTLPKVEKLPMLLLRDPWRGRSPIAAVTCNQAVVPNPADRACVGEA